MLMDLLRCQPLSLEELPERIADPVTGVIRIGDFECVPDSALRGQATGINGRNEVNSDLHVSK